MRLGVLTNGGFGVFDATQRLAYLVNGGIGYLLGWAVEVVPSVFGGTVVVSTPIRGVSASVREWKVAASQAVREVLATEIDFSLQVSAAQRQLVLANAQYRLSPREPSRRLSPRTPGYTVEAVSVKRDVGFWTHELRLTAREVERNVHARQPS